MKKSAEKSNKKSDKKSDKKLDQKKSNNNLNVVLICFRLDVDLNNLEPL